MKLGFLDHEKIKGILNFDLPLILVVTMVDQNLTGFLVDDKSSCNIFYTDLLELLGIQHTDMNPYYGGYLLAFNNSITLPSGVEDLSLTIKEGVCERNVIFDSLLIQCRNTFRGILGKSFLAKLDTVTSLVHLKVTYHDKEGKSTIISVDLEEAK